MQVVDVGSNRVSGNYLCRARCEKIAVTGTLPKDQNLLFLAQMVVDSNWLSGTIEPHSLKHIYFLSASFNLLSGSISRRFGLLTSLEYLLLGDNYCFEFIG